MCKIKTRAITRCESAVVAKCAARLKCYNCILSKGGAYNPSNGGLFLRDDKHALRGWMIASGLTGIDDGFSEAWRRTRGRNIWVLVGDIKGDITTRKAPSNFIHIYTDILDLWFMVKEWRDPFVSLSLAQRMPTNLFTTIVYVLRKLIITDARLYPLTPPLEYCRLMAFVWIKNAQRKGKKTQINTRIMDIYICTRLMSLYILSW